MKRGECLQCGSSLGKYKRKFCSDECQRTHFEEKIAPLWWTNAVAIALKRANNRCEECGSLEDLEVHHKEPLRGESRHGNYKNRIENLIVLCHDCHWKKHRHISNTPKRLALIKAGQLMIGI